MKMRNSTIALMSISLMGAVIVMFSACEKDKATEVVDDFFGDTYASTDRDSEQREEVSLTPTGPSVDTVGEKVAFTVRGGQKPYTWSVSDASAGTISPSVTGTDIEQAIYTTVALTKNTVIVTDGLGRAAVMDVTVSTANLAISPPSFSFLATDMTGPGAKTATFTTSGGAGTITWTTDNGSLGAVVGGVWTSVPTAPASLWSNTTIKVFANDANGTSVSAAITFD